MGNETEYEICAPVTTILKFSVLAESEEEARLKAEEVIPSITLVADSDDSTVEEWGEFDKCEYREVEIDVVEVNEWTTHWVG